MGPRSPVLVYGTLKRGSWNNYLLDRFDAEFQGTAVTSEAIYDLAVISADVVHGSSQFPVAYRGEYQIEGELYLCDADAVGALDLLEQVPMVYNRAVIPIDHDRYETAWLYFGTQFALDLCDKHGPQLETDGQIKRWVDKS